MTAPLIAPATESTGNSDLVHIYCERSPSVAFCGWFDDSDDWLDDWDDEDECVVCADLDRSPYCPMCGER